MYLLKEFFISPKTQAIENIIHISIYNLSKITFFKKYIIYIYIYNIV